MLLCYDDHYIMCARVLHCVYKNISRHKSVLKISAVHNVYVSMTYYLRIIHIFKYDGKMIIHEISFLMLAHLFQAFNYKLSFNLSKLWRFINKIKARTIKEINRLKQTVTYTYNFNKLRTKYESTMIYLGCP